MFRYVDQCWISRSNGCSKSRPPGKTRWIFFLEPQKDCEVGVCRVVYHEPPIRIKSMVDGTFHGSCDYSSHVHHLFLKKHTTTFLNSQTVCLIFTIFIHHPSEVMELCRGGNLNALARMGSRRPNWNGEATRGRTQGRMGAGCNQVLSWSWMICYTFINGHMYWIDR